MRDISWKIVTKRKLLLALLFVMLRMGNSAAGLELAHEGKATATIVLSASPSRTATAAAAELQHYLQLISGARFLIQNENSQGPKPTGTLILVGDSILARQAGQQVSALK